jgi:uncharacterized protein (UPF0333 family)
MKNKVFSLLAAGIALGFVACNNSGETGSTTDSTNNSAANTATSSGNYAARADSINANVTAGNYLNPRTGKAYARLNIDTSTGSLTDESGRRVKRYVDKRTWWVYDTNSWDTVGSAQMKNGSLYYRGDNGDWEEYDRRWSDDMDTTGNASGQVSLDSAGNSDSKSNTSGTKVKVSDKGNKVKVKKTDPK